MMIGQDYATICWMTPYREAYLDLIEHVVRDYDIDAMYFDTWVPLYFWTGMKTCYCEGCKKGFRKATGKEIPYHAHEEDYSGTELQIIEEYHHWYYEEYIKIVQQTCNLIRSYKKIPLIYNTGNPLRISNADPRILNEMDASLYERSETILERAEGVSLARSIGLDVWPYVGVYNNWQRTIYETNSYQQQIFTNIMFGGGAIIAQPYAYTTHSENRKYVSFPFEIIQKHEQILNSVENYPVVGVVYSDQSPPGHAKTSWWDRQIDARTSTLGAFAACLFNHIQVSSLHEFVLDNPVDLKRYPVLYLANIPYLSDQRIKNIKEYVREGGNLIVTYATSLYDTNGNKAGKFGLQELTGVKLLDPDDALKEKTYKYSTKIGGPSDLYLMTTGKGKKLFGEYWNDRLVPAWFYEPVEVDKDADVLMNIVTGDGRQPFLPGVIKRDYSDGQVLYTSMSLEGLFLKDGKYILGELIGQFIHILAKDQIPYTIDAPSFLMGNLVTNEQHWVLHLTNWTGNKFERHFVDDPYLAPIEDVKIEFRIPEGKRIRSVSAFVDVPYESDVSNGKLTIKTPLVEAYQAFQIDFE
jgi:hypothetical protein